MKRESYCPENIKGLEMIPVANKPLILPFEEATYEELITDKAAYRAFIIEQMQRYPELFPPSMKDGWSFYGLTRPSKEQQGLQLRRILTKPDREVWQIHPSFMMPYMTCDTETADDILFLANWAPDWALARVYKKDVMMIYRLRTHMGRYNIVGTTVKAPAQLPSDLGADEKHSRISGQKVYIATTVGKGCFLGGAISQRAGETELTDAYGRF